MSTALEFRNVDIVFGAKGNRRLNGSIQQALAALDAGGSRSEIAEKNNLLALNATI